MTSESSFKAENPAKIVDLASFPARTFVNETSRGGLWVGRTQREFVGVVLHLVQRVGNDPVIYMSFGAVINLETNQLTPSRRRVCKRSVGQAQELILGSWFLPWVPWIL